MNYVLRHKWLGYYLSGRASTGEFAHSPNAQDAVRFESFERGEQERRQLREFSAAWMTVTEASERQMELEHRQRRPEQIAYAEQVVSFVFATGLLGVIAWGVLHFRAH